MRRSERVDWLPVTANLRRRYGRLSRATKSQLARLGREWAGVLASEAGDTE